MELSTKYNPTEIEQKWYQYWLDNKLFHSEPNEKEPFTIVIPPPNVTGVLHMGHMLNNTIQDVLVRRARMQGKNACWVPGTDHASIATEAKVVGKLAAEGIKKTDLTREEFLAHAWEWTHKHGGIILEQLKKLGCSCDWDRTAFTMDEIRSESVLKVFCDLYEKGLIYRGVRMVNWDPKALTALSDEEVNYKEQQGKLYYLKYKIVEENENTAKKEFPDPLNVAVFTTKYVLNENSPVLYVYHDEEDGAWQFLGKEDFSEKDAKIISLEEMINIDRSILELADMPYGYYAHRENNKSKWVIEKIVENKKNTAENDMKENIEPKIGKDDWYRNEYWNEKIENAFEERLKRSRGAYHKAQYLRIQAGILLDSDNNFSQNAGVALMQRMINDFPTETSSTSFGNEQLGDYYYSKADYSKAIQHYDIANDLYKKAINVISIAKLKLVNAILKMNLRNRFDEAYDICKKYKKSDLILNDDKFYYYEIFALLCSKSGKQDEAKKYAETALKISKITEPQFRYHKKVGLINASDEQINVLFNIVAGTEISAPASCAAARPETIVENEKDTAENSLKIHIGGEIENNVAEKFRIVRNIVKDKLDNVFLKIEDISEISFYIFLLKDFTTRPRTRYVKKNKRLEIEVFMPYDEFNKADEQQNVDIMQQALLKSISNYDSKIINEKSVDLIKSEFAKILIASAQPAIASYAIVATTRPETIFGDTAMCINPNNPKTAHLKGKRVIVPLINREIPVIEDEYVDVEFGTGCLKVTPAHDINDYMLGEKYNLPSIDIFNDNGTLNANGAMYAGMDRFECRKQIEKDLENAGLMEKIEPYTNKVGFSERTDVPIEPKLSMQWFLKMEDLAAPALENVENDTIKFYPEKFKNTYRHWLTNIKDWCISRQLWWGHQIPAWYIEVEDEEKK